MWLSKRTNYEIFVMEKDVAKACEVYNIRRGEMMLTQSYELTSSLPLYHLKLTN